MVISLKTEPNQRVIELGGGKYPKIRPNIDCRECFDDAGNPTVDMVVDFNDPTNPLPLETESWDGVFSQYAFEHISWRRAKSFVSEIYRILKPGGKCILVVPNTEEQLKWIQNNPDGWDKKSFFESASGKLFGDLDYPENSHKMYLSPSIVTDDLFKDFGNVTVTPCGARNTDMIVEAVKIAKTLPVTNLSTLAKEPKELPMQSVTSEQPSTIIETPEQQFDRTYFNGKHYTPFYWDYPVHEVITANILKHRPKSVLELGCARGYVLKRIQDRGIRGCGLDVSQHCWLSRACEGIIRHDVNTPWPFKNKEFDLCYSHDFLQWLPNDLNKMHDVLEEMERVSSRCVHAVPADKVDNWYHELAKYFSAPVVVSIEEMCNGPFPQEVLKGDGKTKLNLGSFMTMFHHGWTNIDVVNLTDFANQNQYKFMHHDLRSGLPAFGTESVDLIYLCHVLEHFSYNDGLTLLKECRRVLKPGGTMRVVVPDACLLLMGYSGADYNKSQGVCCVTDIVDYNELSDSCANAPTDASKLYALLHEGHQSIYDCETLVAAMQSAGFIAQKKAFREGNEQILKETVDMKACISLFVEGVPRTT